MTEMELPTWKDREVEEMQGTKVILMPHLLIEASKDLIEKGLTTKVIARALSEFLKQSIDPDELGRVVALYISGEPLRIGGHVPDIDPIARQPIDPALVGPIAKPAVNKASGGGFPAPSKSFTKKKEGEQE